MNYSPGLQNKITELSLKKENILYLPTAQEYMHRIRSGKKKIEFRDNTDYYAKKLAKFDKSGEFVEDKPITHILFQGGYNADSPRMLTEMKEYLAKYEKIENPDNPKTLFLLDEAGKEGFEFDDEYIGLFIGKIEYEENF